MTANIYDATDNVKHALIGSEIWESFFVLENSFLKLCDLILY